MLDSFQKIKNIERFYLAELDKSKQQLLCLSDEFYGEPLKTDVLKESDLAPNKPKCDLIIQGFAYSDTPKPFFNAAFEFCALDDNPHCQNSCHPHPNNLNGGKGDNHGTIQCRTQTSNTRQTFITHTHQHSTTSPRRTHRRTNPI